MDLVEFVKLGGKLSLNKKMGLKDWYSEFTLSYFDNQPFFTGFDYSDYRTNLTVEESVYVFLSVYKHWNNYAYLIERLKSKNEFPEILDDYDFEYPTEEFTSLLNKEKRLAKKEWYKEFSQEILDSYKKPVIKDIDKKLEELLKDKSYNEYCIILTNFLTEFDNLGINVRVYFYFERGEKKGSYGVELKNKEYSKNQINSLINKTNPELDYESITICVYVDETRYSYNDKVKVNE